MKNTMLGILVSIFIGLFLWAVILSALTCTYETDIDINLVYCTTDDNCPVNHICVDGFCMEVTE